MTETNLEPAMWEVVRDSARGWYPLPNVGGPFHCLRIALDFAADMAKPIEGRLPLRTAVRAIMARG